jgi:hypothetical protein
MLVSGSRRCNGGLDTILHICNNIEEEEVVTLSSFKSSLNDSLPLEEREAVE